MRNHRSLRLQLLIRTLFTVGLVTLIMIDAFVLQNNNETDKTKEITTAATMNNSDSNAASFIHAKEIQQEHDEDRSRHGDLSYVVSKRKVPRGPDPIHNRRARNSRRPPGRA
ncbi:PREDICTED: CLAVATA3/ESR (CLE)-related protein 26-like [Camelina sativa]|uniref:CLAVATA3/ESR (CLE)-related protein 26-like n=1 Tax=Camelina sativa TaxID=90675 RepID=A0ABM0SSX3_CAMSA|nr:PREDICTED: CLAVATA3/ESR (CLE)-related protein 26-like [Camelina sativa]XP_010512063.1 PREDICTED: CLAVATA3/ESR (CLE)-related protein 26-like [Camelina sativa]